MMSAAQTSAAYAAGAVACFLLVAFLIRWGRPVDGQLSPRLRGRGMEMLVNAIASTSAIAGIGLLAGVVLTLVGR